MVFEDGRNDRQIAARKMSAISFGDLDLAGARMV
jgi:hypothetical protein